MLPIYIISLERDLERRKIIKRKLDELNLQYEVVDAVYGKDLPVQDIDALDFSAVVKRKKLLPTRGEIGCTLSHLKAYQLITDRNQQWACILEDDAIIDSRFASFCQYLGEDTFSRLSVNHLHLLGGQNGLYCSRYVSLSHWHRISIGGQIFRKSIKSENYLYRTCCYLISGKAAMNLLSLSASEFFIADEWSYFLRKGIFKEIYLANFVDHPLDLNSSHIENERKIARADLGSDSFCKKAQFIKKLLDNLNLKYKVKHVFRILRAKARAFYFLKFRRL